jgi:hypothetical protein
MSILTNILNTIFPHDHPANTASTGATAPAAPSPSTAVSTAATASGPTVAASRVQPPIAALPAVDVEAVLTDMQAGNGTQLNWRTSIVDLLKLLNLDSSLEARKELAAELNYSGNTGDSSAMNIWLHKQVMRKLAENGGEVPNGLKG